MKMDKTSITTQQNRKYCQTTGKFMKSQTGVFILFITKQLSVFELCTILNAIFF